MRVKQAKLQPATLRKSSDYTCIFLLPEDKKSSILTGKKFPETDEYRGDYLHIRIPSFFFTEEGESPAISLNILLKCDKSLNPQE